MEITCKLEVLQKHACNGRLAFYSKQFLGVQNWTQSEPIGTLHRYINGYQQYVYPVMCLASWKVKQILPVVLGFRSMALVLGVWDSMSLCGTLPILPARCSNPFFCLKYNRTNRKISLVTQ